LLVFFCIQRIKACFNFYLTLKFFELFYIYRLTLYDFFHTICQQIMYY
uniref:Ovule protein n=1 Tax=Brugia timori TaxID=42155 RepID=A0A0R3QZ09_9BILA